LLEHGPSKHNTCNHRTYLSKHICWVHFFCLFDSPPPPLSSPLVCFVQEFYSPARDS
jgi:hypothetical protein